MLRNYITENTGPDDQGYGPRFPEGTGMGMLDDIRRLMEGARIDFPKAKKAAKKINKEAMGRTNVGKKAKLKAGSQPENLRVKRKKKTGPFGEAYQPPPGNAPKGKRVTESMRESFRKKFRRFRAAVEKAPPGWEGTVKHMKKHKNIDNPWALAWSMKNQGDTPHH